jgi:hypothetical protein
MAGKSGSRAEVGPVEPDEVHVGEAAHGKIEEPEPTIAGGWSKKEQKTIPWYVRASADIVIDVSTRWPTEADLHEIAKFAAESVTVLDITEDEIFTYLSCCRP